MCVCERENEKKREREKEIFGMEGETRKNLRRNRGRERKGIEKL